jgi:hypothetical protein
MARFLGLFVFAAAFLFISPSLRGSAMDGLGALAAYTNDYSPYSYVVLGILVLGGITLTLRTGQTAR